MRREGRFMLGGIIGFGLGYALILLFHPLALTGKRRERAGPPPAERRR